MNFYAKYFSSCCCLAVFIRHSKAKDVVKLRDMEPPLERKEKKTEQGAGGIVLKRGELSPCTLGLDLLCKLRLYPGRKRARESGRGLEGRVMI